MNSTRRLSEEQVASFVEKGYVVIPSVLNDRQVELASRALDRELAQQPMPDGHVSSYSLKPHDASDFKSLLSDSEALAWVEGLLGEGNVRLFGPVQLAFNVPPYSHRPGGHHLDGVSVPDGDRPGTFSILAGLLMSDQSQPNSGNLWVWPGTHKTHEAFFRQHGAAALMASNSSPAIALPEPEVVRGRPGDLLLAHYMLGHNIGGNTSSIVRRAIYFRLMHQAHKERWERCLMDAWLDFEGLSR